MLERLKIIPAEKVITFEEPDQERVSKTIDDLTRENRLRNPLLVKYLDESYLLLDDISILSALRNLGVCHVPVQLADEGQLTVRPWQRIVEKIDRDEVQKFGWFFPRQIICETNVSRSLLPNQAEIIFHDRGSIRLTFVSDSFSIKVDLYIKFAKHFLSSERGFRAKLNHRKTDVFKGFPSALAAIFPPRFSFDDLLELCRRRIYLPYGMLRIDQPGRIFGIDYSLSVLKEAAPAEEKQAFLAELLRIRMLHNQTGYYDGHVFVFNS